MPILIGLLLVWAGVEDWRFPGAAPTTPTLIPSPAGSSDGTNPSGPAFTPSADPVDETSAPPQPSAMPASLFDLPWVEGAVNNRIDLDRHESLEIDGVTYGRVLAYQCSTFCNGSSPQIVEATLGRKFNTFTATASVLDTANGTYQIDITLDGHTPVTYTTSPGESAEIELDVAGVSRMRIELFASDDIMHPLQCGVNVAGGQSCGELPGVALGDPMLSP